MNIEDFADKHDLILVIRKRNDPSLPRYLASFEFVDVLEGPMLTGAFGNGNTPNEAVEDYAKEISNKTIIHDAFGKSRREIRVPKLINVYEAKDIKSAKDLYQAYRGDGKKHLRLQEDHPKIYQAYKDYLKKCSEEHTTPGYFDDWFLDYCFGDGT